MSIDDLVLSFEFSAAVLCLHFQTIKRYAGNLDAVTASSLYARENQTDLDAHNLSSAFAAAKRPFADLGYLPELVQCCEDFASGRVDRAMLSRVSDEAMQAQVVLFFFQRETGLDMPPGLKSSLFGAPALFIVPMLEKHTDPDTGKVAGLSKDILAKLKAGMETGRYSVNAFTPAPGLH